MSGSSTSSTSGANPYGFTTDLSGATSQMPSTLGGLGSTSNLTSNGTAAASGYTPTTTSDPFSVPSTSSGMNMQALQSGLASGAKIANTGSTSTPKQTMSGGSGKVTTSPTTFSSGLSSSASGGSTGASTGVQSLLALMQSLKG